MNAFCANTHMFFSRRKVYIAILQHLTSLAHLLYLLCKENNTMLNHYFKIATRNLLKYKLQSVISIIGLAVGFTCFALAALWIRYERSYDTFHHGADRIFLVRNESKMGNNGLSSVTPYPLAAYLQETFPEIEYACNTSDYKTEIKYNNVVYPVTRIAADSAFMKLFPVRILKGNANFQILNGKEVAITEEITQKVFGEENPLGKKLIISGEEIPICAIVKSWSKHSNMPFDLVEANYQFPHWNASGWQTYIKLREGTDSKAFIKKIYDHVIKKEDATITNFVLTPITKLRYDHPLQEGIVKYNHITLFAAAGGLVILCALFNYLTLFVSRIRLRGKEIALRKVCGSSDKHLMGLFSVEYLLTLILSIFIGMLLIEIVLPSFKELSEIQLVSSGIYLETIAYSGIVAFLSYLFSLLPIYYFRRQSLNNTIKGAKKGNGKDYFQKLFIVFQLIISIGIIFCTFVMIKQVHHLNHTDRIIERKGKGTLTIYNSTSEASVREELKQIPMITGILPGKHNAFIPSTGSYYCSIKEWDEKPGTSQEVDALKVASGEYICSYYNLKLLEGTMLKENSAKNKAMINETAARQFGWDNAIGKTFQFNDSTRMEVVGIICDFCKESPTVPIKPMIFTTPEWYTSFSNGCVILFDFQEGQWKECKMRIEALLKEKHTEIVIHSLFNAEEVFDEYLQSERALIKLLDFVSIVCILISVFGIFSLVTLNCEQRRKEIAIRKVNGASVGTIVRMFFKEYLLLLCVAAAIALPVSYLIMKAWLENYVIQTTIPFWIYLILFISLVMITVTCIYWRIWKAASKNPAEVIKFE